MNGSVLLLFLLFGLILITLSMSFLMASGAVSVLYITIRRRYDNYHS